MFGYVRVCKPELKVKEYEMYKSVYCSLCKHLGKKYGILSRMTLSYDFTFLALLNMSMKGDCEEFYRGRCAFNPIKKCNYCKSDKSLEFPAAAAMIMLYYKILDNIADEKGLKKIGFYISKLFFIRPYRKAAKLFPNIDITVRDYIAKQTELEKNGNTVLDAAAEPTADAMAKILSLCSESEAQKRILRRIGYCLGRYIYILDAACDYEKDLKTNSYNCFKFEESFDREKIYSQLYFCINEATLAFELLDIKKFKGILVNILYNGLEETFKKELSQI